MKKKTALLLTVLLSSMSAQAWIDCESGPKSKGIVRVSFGVGDKGYSLDYFTSDYSVFGSTSGSVPVSPRAIVKKDKSAPLTYQNVKSVKGKGYTWGSDFTATLNLQTKTFTKEYHQDGKKEEVTGLICDFDRQGI
jgi:hypothetical protein